MTPALPRGVPPKGAAEDEPRSKVRGYGPAGAAREHELRHIDRLYEISKLLTSFRSVEETMPVILGLVTEALPLESAILIEETGDRPRAIVWHSTEVDPKKRQTAEANASASYAYLVPEGFASRELAVSARPSPLFGGRGFEGSSEPDSQGKFIFLPLVTDHLPIAGGVQFEVAKVLDPIDLAFLNAVANQLAIALDRHHAWKNELALRARAEALAAENARLLEKAEAAIRAREEFISIAAHELRSPINALGLFAENLARHDPTLAIDLAHLERGHALLQRQTSKLAMLVDKLLDVARLAAGQLTLEIQDNVDLAALVREVTARFELDAEHAGCVLIVEADRPVIGRWDRLRLEQVLTNLLSNAIKFSLKQPIEVRVESRDATARLVVRDHGPGIAPEDRPRIFERFERGSHPSGYRGLGLGLHITREIVQRHGGSIRVESEPGHGSTFTVELPLEPPTKGGS